MIVSDTSVISNLLLIGQVELLPQLFAQITVPQAVFTELQRFSAFDISSTLQASWLSIKRANDLQAVVRLRTTLDAGESEAIVLARELQADLLIIDESKGRKVASSFGLAFTGLLGILLRAKTAGIIFEVKPLIHQLENEANFFVSPAVRSHILTLAGE